eukprot:TRINITY_DN8962_c0_g1_i1.p1 TRINITY_DN8962_c0_g1~~TRINITY_DN8962_c0_g1_i1.p1  ORF type:complete len:150 (-),score=58.11 TRINITY_DN8962_c0_g1_i1:50-499(-)
MEKTEDTTTKSTTPTTTTPTTAKPTTTAAAGAGAEKVPAKRDNKAKDRANDEDEEEKARPIVVFTKEGLEKLKRKQLQSLAKRAGSKANLNSDELKKFLHNYYDEHKAEITEIAQERKAKREANKRPRKRKLTDELKSTLNWGKRTDID